LVPGASKAFALGLSPFFALEPRHEH
jgi:hypothetical protein